MTNKFKKIKIILIYINLIYINPVSAEDVVINAEVIDIKNKGNLIIASGSVNINDTNNVSIVGNEAKVLKIKKS